MTKKALILISAILMGSAAYAQGAGPQMADGLRAEGKFYVVLAVILIIFVCLAAFLFYIERKLSRLEKDSRVNHAFQPEPVAEPSEPRH